MKKKLLTFLIFAMIILVGLFAMIILVGCVGNNGIPNGNYTRELPPGETEGEISYNFQGSTLTVTSLNFLGYEKAILKYEYYYEDGELFTKLIKINDTEVPDANSWGVLPCKKGKNSITIGYKNPLDEDDNNTEYVEFKKS